MSESQSLSLILLSLGRREILEGRIREQDISSTRLILEICTQEHVFVAQIPAVGIGHVSNRQGQASQLNRKGVDVNARQTGAEIILHRARLGGGPKIPQKAHGGNEETRVAASRLKNLAIRRRYLFDPGCQTRDNVAHQIGRCAMNPEVGSGLSRYQSVLVDRTQSFGSHVAQGSESLDVTGG